ncbi:MAG TPA: MFS transporter [Euzebyales bacterium]|nr:MFS transporter [Euzebyales bacterium]
MIRSLRPLAHREFRVLTSATLISVLGDGLMRVALPLQVLAISGDDPLAIGIVGFTWALGHVVSLPVGGLLSDRRERRTIMIGSDLVRAVAIGTVGALGALGDLELWHIVTLGGLFGFANGFFNPAARSLVPDLLPYDQLPRGNALLGFARPLQLWIVGPLAAGALVALAGPGAALLVDAATFVGSALLLSRLPRRGSAAGSAALQRPLEDLREGVRFVRANRWTAVWFLTAGFSTLAFHGPFDVLLPTMLKVDLQLSEAQAGWWIAAIFASGGAGALMVSTFVGQHDLPRRFMTVLYCVEAVTLFGMAAFAVVSGMWQALLIGFVVFGATVFSEIIADTTLQREVPRALLGRVISLQWFVTIGLAPVSFALAGPLGRLYGARPVLATVGLVAGTIVVLVMFVPGARTPQVAARRRHRSDLVSR